MAQIVTITNPLTGQPAQVDQLEHTAQQIDDATARAIPGGAIDIDLSNKMGGIESTDYPGCYYHLVNGVVEWFNPPMLLDEEYRTTERYNGKPVYAKLVEIESLADGSATAITVYKYGVAIDATDIVDYDFIYTYKPNDVAFHCKNISVSDEATIRALAKVSNSPAGSGRWDGAYITIRCFTDMSGYSVKCLFKYIKE